MSRTSKVRTKSTKRARTTPRLLLSVDPAAAAGLAVFYEGKLVAHGPADGSTWVGLVQALKPMLEPWQHVPAHERLTVIEESWSSGKGGQTLALRRGLAQAAAEALGFRDFIRVGASTWQSALFGSTKVDTKAESQRYCEEQLGFIPVIHDVADSAALGSYYLRYCCE